MSFRPTRTLSCLAAALFVLTGVVVVNAPAGATVDTTAITTPSGTKYFTFTPGGLNQLPVAGTASAGVTNVDVDCINSTGAVLNVYPFALNVPVTSGAWSTTATYPFLVDSCRLRAIPSGTPTSGDLSMFTGPILYTSTLAPVLDTVTSTTYGFTAVGGEGDGLAVLQDVGQCGISTLATIQTPSLISGPVTTNCGMALP